MKKKLVSIIALFAILSVNSQEINNDFLNSLPDDIKKDLEERNSQKDSNLQENYRPYLYSSKLSQAEELLELKDRLELDLKELERRLNIEGNELIDKELKIFGSNFFNTFQTTFMPINEPNPGSKYILDIGDKLNIQIIGQNDSINDYLIDGSGSITLRDIGKIVLSGLTLSEASNLIKNKISSAYIATEAFVSLSQIRDVNVLVTGNAKNPGIYTLTGNSNILQAISAAGGISEQGSYREINLLRDNKIIESLDVYDLLINGRYNLNKRLRSGDVIFVEKRKNIITIDGAVNRPAMYEVHDNENLDKVIDYANGLKRTADLQNVSLERILDGTLKTISVVNKSQFATIKAIDGDLIYIREHAFRKAKISGAVLKPGTYLLAEGESINDLVDKAGGYTENAYLFGAIFETEAAKKINENARELLYEEFLDNIIGLSQQNVGQNIDLKPLIGLTKEIKNAKTSGRVVIDLQKSDLMDLHKVQSGDLLHIPEKPNVVYIYGETSTEGSVRHEAKGDLKYYIEKAGGFKKFADKKSIFVIYPNGEAKLFSVKRNIFESTPRSEMEIFPGSVIYVPRKLDESTSNRLATQAYVSILGNLGIALASLSSINNN